MASERNKIQFDVQKNLRTMMRDFISEESLRKPTDNVVLSIFRVELDFRSEAIHSRNIGAKLLGNKWGKPLNDVMKSACIRHVIAIFPVWRPNNMSRVPKLRNPLLPRKTLETVLRWRERGSDSHQMRSLRILFHHIYLISVVERKVKNRGGLDYVAHLG